MKEDIKKITSQLIDLASKEVNATIKYCTKYDQLRITFFDSEQDNECRFLLICNNGSNYVRKQQIELATALLQDEQKALDFIHKGWDR